MAHDAPQSTPVSSPFWKRSEQVGTRTQAVQDPLQSTPYSSPFWTPSEQLGGVQEVQEPPQSTPVSSPFRVPSEQVTAASGTEKCVIPLACASSPVHAALRTRAVRGTRRLSAPARVCPGRYGCAWCTSAKS